MHFQSDETTIETRLETDPAQDQWLDLHSETRVSSKLLAAIAKFFMEKPKNAYCTTWEPNEAKVHRSL